MKDDPLSIQPIILSSEADVVDWLKIWMEDGSPEEIAALLETSRGRRV